MCKLSCRKWRSCASSKDFTDAVNFKPGFVMTWVCLCTRMCECVRVREKRGGGRKDDEDDRVS